MTLDDFHGYPNEDLKAILHKGINETVIFKAQPLQLGAK